MKKYLLMALIVLFQIQTAQATTCAGAATAVLGSNTLACSGTNDIDNIAGCGDVDYQGGEEALFTFTATATGNLTLDYIGIDWTGIFVWDGCPTTGTCVGTPVTSSATSKSMTVPIVNGTTYYIMIDTWPSPDEPCPGTLTISFTLPPTPPSNDECSGATALSVNTDLNCGTVTSTTNIAATASPQADDVSGTPDSDVWYTFVATSTVHQVALSNVTGSTDMGMGVYDLTGGCNALVFTATSDPNTLDLTGLTVGNTYAVRVYSWSSGTAGTDFDICIGTPPPPPSNDECSGAIGLTVNADLACGVVTSTTNVNATASPQTDDVSGTPDSDVWYTFVATDIQHQVVLSNVSGNTDMGMGVYDLTGGCNALVFTATSDPNTLDLTGLTIGSTYAVRVYSWGSGTAGTSFDVCIGTPPPPPPGAACANAQPFCAPSGTSIDFTAQATGNAAEAGNDYGCLSTQPDPTWFYFKVGVAGNIDIDITGNSDVDFALWGPFADLTAAQTACGSLGTPVSCSYTASATEQANVPGAVLDDIYLLVVTNYAAVSQNISVSLNIASTGATDCSIATNSPCKCGEGSCDGGYNADETVIDAAFDAMTTGGGADPTYCFDVSADNIASDDGLPYEFCYEYTIPAGVTQVGFDYTYYSPAGCGNVAWSAVAYDNTCNELTGNGSTSAVDGFPLYTVIPGQTYRFCQTVTLDAADLDCAGGEFSNVCFGIFSEPVNSCDADAGTWD